jgi:hypothetical protein
MLDVGRLSERPAVGRAKIGDLFGRRGHLFVLANGVGREFFGEEKSLDRRIGSDKR